MLFLCQSFVFKATKARGTHIRVHYKHCREIAQAIKGLSVPKAKAYLQNVLLYKDAIPFTKYTGGIGRHAVGKNYNAPGDKVAWPQKATKTFLDLLTNIASNSEVWDIENYILQTSYN
jgi:large subunit ribosomal protein L17e